MAAPHNKLTEEQIGKLRGNRYISSVGERMVIYTEEFKHLYWYKYTVEKLMPYEILRQLGIDYQILGGKRVQGITQNLKKRFGGQKAEENSEPGQAQGRSKQAPPQKLNRLRAENEYLKQEIEFLKKIISIAPGEKR